MHGWHGKLLRVDLTDGAIRLEDIPADILHSCLGGRGLGIRLMRDFSRLGPLEAEMPLIFCAGPLCGTTAPCVSTLSVVFRSPLTLTIFDNPINGRFPMSFKAAGFDALVITGVSRTPAVLRLTPGSAELLPADGLSGATTDETAMALGRFGSTAAIGPAGESGVLFASIVTEEGNSGRGGIGAVMGSKRLKAVVAAGDRETAVADPKRFEGACRDILRLYRASPFLCGELGIGRFGSPALVDLINQRRMTPTANFRETFFPGSRNYSGPALRAAYGSTENGCPGCPVGCRHKTRTGRLLPDFDSLSHFGALNRIEDLETIVKADSLCTALGMDPVSAAAVMAAWGESEGRFAAAGELPGLLDDIAHRRGKGEFLSLGSRRMAESIGRPELSMSVKSLELPAYDPRGGYGLALAYAVSTQGGSLHHACPIYHEVLRKPVPTDRFSFSGKARITVNAEDAIAAGDSLAVCRFPFLAASLEEYAELLSSATGIDYTPGDLQRIGAGVCRTERHYNTANGFGPADDRLPERFFLEPGSGGDGISIPPINRERFQEELGKYYRIRGTGTW